MEIFEEPPVEIVPLLIILASLLLTDVIKKILTLIKTIKKFLIIYLIPFYYLLTPNAGAETLETRQRWPIDSPATCFVFFLCVVFFI